MIDWSEIFAFDVAPLEMFVRGTCVYLGLFCILRFILKRQAGSVGISDLLVIVLLADAAQNAMAAEYNSVSDGFILVATLVFWNYTLERLGYHFPAVERFIHPSALALVRNGRYIRRHMQQEFITQDDIASFMRQEGIEHLSEVKLINLEGDGKMSLIKRKRD